VIEPPRDPGKPIAYGLRPWQVWTTRAVYVALTIVLLLVMIR
jgi:hypothetical protein